MLDGRGAGGDEHHLPVGFGLFCFVLFVAFSRFALLRDISIGSVLVWFVCWVIKPPSPRGKGRFRFFWSVGVWPEKSPPIQFTHLPKYPGEQEHRVAPLRRARRRPRQLEGDWVEAEPAQALQDGDLWYLCVWGGGLSGLLALLGVSVGVEVGTAQAREGGLFGFLVYMSQGGCC